MLAAGRRRSAATPAVSLAPNQCSLTVGYPSPCPSPLIDLNVLNPPGYIAAASEPGLTRGPIDVWGYCRYVDNITATSGAGQAAFVPFRSSDEWLAFINNAPPAFFALSHCARPALINLMPDSSGTGVNYDPVDGSPPETCDVAVPPAQAIVLPYGRENETVTETTAFHCTSNKTNTSWTRNMTAKFVGLDSDNAANKPNWKMIEKTMSTYPRKLNGIGQAHGT
jgi:hypothetical protein